MYQFRLLRFGDSKYFQKVEANSLHSFGTSIRSRNISGFFIPCSELKFFAVWKEGLPVITETIRKIDKNYDHLLNRFSKY